jgi:glycine oxidase
LFSDDGQVNGSTFLEAAIAAARSYGAVIEENAAEFELKPFVERGGKAVVAAGAWTDPVLAPLGVRLGVSPVRGQLIVYETPSPVLPYPVYTKSGGYVTPKSDGTTLAGTTIENVGYNSDTTNEGQKHIIGLLSTLMPSLIDRPVRKVTAGLRPKSPDDLPFIGALPSYPNVIVASGHYRNGILLAPITAKAVGALMSGSPFPLSLKPFSPSRILSKA